MDAKLTPMLRQYLDIKKQHPDDILFFRMGDFYEMFFDDAHKASRVLDIALTSRQNDVPMCGIPFHAAESYLARLVKAGHRVAICEQLETVPSQGTIVRREVVRVITPGTLTESNLLQTDDHNFLCSAVIEADGIGLAFVDVSTGDFFISRLEPSIELFRAEITRFEPREVVFARSEKAEDQGYQQMLESRSIPLHRLNPWIYDTDYLETLLCETFSVKNLKSIEAGSPVEILAAGSVIEYLRDTQRQKLSHLKMPRRIIDSDYMLLDEATISNLELVRNQQDRTRARTLFAVLDATRTAMGKRLLERSIVQPLRRKDLIEERLDIVQYLYEYNELTEELSALLRDIMDLERFVSRLSLGRILPRDLAALSASLRAADCVRDLCLDQASEPLQQLGRRINDFADLVGEIAGTLCDEPAISPEQGRVIREGVNPELDKLYSLKKDARGWIAEYQEAEKARLDIPSLRIKYNRILGYYIEVSKGQQQKVPAEYLRKQTLVNAERFTTTELQKFESDILGASDKIVEIESAILTALVANVLQHSRDIQQAADGLGLVDMYQSLAVRARKQRYVRPVIADDGSCEIRDARHPVVEAWYTREVFIPNDIVLDSRENIIKLITGPNMAGKSTYIRTAAIIQLMAQIGSFVPATSATLPLADRIFTRIGASDNISRGESTFLVEMNETALILNNATDRSLIIMDEVGRGTSTYDGLALAWAIVEYISTHLRARTLFATHYHELTELGGANGIVNYTVMVRENAGGVDFLHKVVPGSADRSYGIHVARLAGLPGTITGRAEKILQKLEKKSRKLPTAPTDEPVADMSLFNAANHRLVRALEQIDTNALTPLDALNELSRLKGLL